ncbi:MAG: DUF4856 domain-containing protein [Gammaproteobacteria bacterium]|nr:DUF4856 domain-containing protein [Gammaproteobacteria bacterium]
MICIYMHGAMSLLWLVALADHSDKFLGKIQEKIMDYRSKTGLAMTVLSIALLAAGCSDDDNDSPTATLDSSSNSVVRGSKVTLTWSSENADTCTASGDWSGNKGASGSEETMRLRKDSTFVITCSKDGDSADSSVDVTATDVTQPTTYAGFPVTLDPAATSADTDQDSSVSYAGQMTRAVLRDSAKASIKAAASVADAQGVVNYIKNENNVIDDTMIVAPTTKNEFIVKETIYNELGTEKNLYGKLFDTSTGYATPIRGVTAGNENITLGFPGDKSAKEVIDIWLAAFEADHAANTDGTPDYYREDLGFDFSQLFPKFLMGAVFYNESINHYLDENLEPGVKDNDLPYKDGKYYTGKEHSWDEGFGWFGAAAHYRDNTAQENYEIAKMGKDISQADALALADADGDGAVSLYTEYNSGPAYYAASFDKDTGCAPACTYGHDSLDAWLEGRTIIANAVDADGNARKLNDTERTDLKALADTIRDNWEMVFAEAAFKYAGISFEQLSELRNGTATDPDATTKAYYHVWSELKGFMMALQYGGSKAVIDKTNFDDIDGLIGFGPVQLDGDQVTGIDGSNNFTLTAGSPDGDGVDATKVDAYLADLLSVQEKLDALYTLKAKQFDNRP